MIAGVTDWLQIHLVYFFSEVGLASQIHVIMHEKRRTGFHLKVRVGNNGFGGN